MKKVNLLAAAVLAAAFAMPAQADFTPNANFNGYLRSGVMHGNSAFGSKTHVERIGRLGNENDTYMEFGLGADILKVDDVLYSVGGMLAYGAGGEEKNWDEDNNLVCEQAFASAQNLLGQGDDLLWIGKRFYKREDIHITDWKYYNISGYGVGLENVVLGPGKISVAWTRHDKDFDNYSQKEGYNDSVSYDTALRDAFYAEQPVEANYTDKSEYKKAFEEWMKKADKAETFLKANNKPSKVKVNNYDVRYEFPVWDGAVVELGATYLEAEKDKSGYYRTYTIQRDDRIADGLNLCAELNLSVLGGYNKTVVQSFSGSSAADVHYGSGSEVYEDEGQGWRVINHGDIYFTKGVGLSHAFIYAHSSGFKSYDNEKSISLVVRPFYQLTKMTKLLAEVGWFADKKTANTDDNGVQSYVSNHGSKYTLAYAISPDASNIGARPEFRFYVSHVSVSDNMNIGPTYEWVRQTSDNMFGAQVEAWW